MIHSGTALRFCELSCIERCLNNNDLAFDIYATINLQPGREVGFRSLAHSYMYSL